MSKTPPPLPLELYRGSVNAWECDENRHMNVRFFAARAMEGLAFLAAAIDMPRAFQEKASSTLLVRDMHVRFHKEAHQGAALSMRGGVVALGETTMTVVQELAHADGKTAATFVSVLAHAHPHKQTPFPWSSRVRARAEGLMCALPAHAKPRSITTAAPTAPTVAEAEALGAPVVGRLMVTPDHCDAFGWMRMELFLGRVSDAVPNLLADWRAEVGRAAGIADANQTGGAVLEYRLCPRRWPRAGDLLEVRSGVVEVAEKTNRLVHWLLDPVSGDAWCTAEAVAVTFDLTTRKTIVIPPAQRAALETRAVPGMHI
ncbi:MAG: hotdog domain-containing protein [Hyphomonadaceae bacterium]|nr:hotdog domain-containing protein [Hyphomonadaceae bacterium]